MRVTLNLPALYIWKSYIKIKINLIFTVLCGASKGFMKALKTFIKYSGAPQRKVKSKIEVRFFSSSRIGTGRVKYIICTNSNKICCIYIGKRLFLIWVVLSETLFLSEDVFEKSFSLSFEDIHNKYLTISASNFQWFHLHI